MERDVAVRRRVVHEDGEGAFVVVEVVLGRRHGRGLGIGGGDRSDLDEAKVGRVAAVFAVLFQHLFDDVGGRVGVRE